MDSVTISMDLPKDILLAADISEANAPADVKRHLALYMLKERILSFGKAAELSGMSKLDFVELAGSKGIPLNYDTGDYHEDLKVIQQLSL